MQEVELRLVANNKDAVKGVRELQQESQKLYSGNEKAQKREKGLIADIEKELEKLKEAKRKAYTLTDIEKYNKKIKEAELNLKGYNEAGLKFEKTATSMNDMIQKWALSLGGAAAAFTILKEAVLATTAGINAFNIAGAATKQVLHNLVTGTGDLTRGMTEAIVVQKELNRLRIQEKIDLFESSKQMILFKKYSVEAHDQTKTATERIKAYDKAIEANNKSIAIRKEGILEELIATQNLLKVKEGDEKLTLRYIELSTELNELEYERFSRLTEMTSMRSGLVKKVNEEEIKFYEDLNKLIDEYIDNIKDRKDELTLLSLSGIDKQLKEIELARAAELKEWGDTEERKALIMQKYNLIRENLIREHYAAIKQQMLEFAYSNLNDPRLAGTDILGKALTPDTAPTPANMLLRTNKTFYDAQRKMIENAQDLAKKADEKDLEDKQKRVDAIKNMVNDLANIAQDITQRAIEEAQRTRELLDTQINETQQALDTEVALYEAGYASNVSAKKKQLEDLKALRAQALIDEEEAIKKQKQLDTVMQTSALITASAQTIKAFPGPLLPIAIGIITAMFAAFASAKLRARETVKLASGGHGEVNGRLHSEGGEAFLGHIEVEDGERWGVLSRTASRRYGKVFANMVDSFNKGRIPIPKGAHNNIIVNNEGTNTRLERVENQLIKLNQYFEGQEVTSDNGGTSVMKRGNTVRIIKRR